MSNKTAAEMGLVQPTAWHEYILAGLMRLISSAPVLLLAALFFLYYEFIARYVLSAYLGLIDSKSLVYVAALVGYTLLCFFAGPALFGKIILRNTWEELGLCLPKNKKLATFLILAGLVFFLPNMYYFSQQAAFQTNYALNHLSMAKFALIQLVLLPPYYFAEEFFFRGFLFLNLWRRLKWHSFWITDIIFTFAHAGKPGLEILLAILGSVVFNYLTLKTRSIYPAIVVHGITGIALNILVNARFF